MLGFRPKCNVYSLVEVVLRIGRLPTQTPMIFFPGFKTQPHDEVLGDS